MSGYDVRVVLSVKARVWAEDADAAMDLLMKTTQVTNTAPEVEQLTSYPVLKEAHEVSKAAMEPSL